MQAILYGLQVTVVGMLVVFAGLIILIACVKLMGTITGKGVKKKETPEQTPAPVQRVNTPAPQATQDRVLLAVITAAISAAMAAESGVQPGPGGFTVRSIRRVNNAPAWNRAGREEQMYSRL